ncbi:hypothetical protein [Nesterenkonia sphaerica]|uniref:CobQ/CobB/MinD/ParA nucleotide binding domain-containing protein n=1 Tax=Nesterenkonia sphaerica TaxID=1804988 RepID=A0A5R9A339_9MICC|nr:hypothetical protein [Nesterenkonia sphaerica]TLP73109.1 hypothetical protein FEF27_10880 [Nesterenkonia sphaerica]
MTRTKGAASRSRRSSGQAAGASHAEPVLVLVAQDQRLRDEVALIAAVVGARLAVFRHWDQVDRPTAGAAVAVLCAPTCLPVMAAQVEPCLVVGHDAEAVWQAAAQRPGLLPVPLPTGEKWLTEHLAGEVLHRSQGWVLVVAGATGGIGVTTFAYLCAAELAARGMRPLLLDAVGGPGSGPADLVRGARSSGELSGGDLDWQQLEAVEGELSVTQLREAVPVWEGIGFLTAGAAAPSHATVRAAAVASRRGYDAVVIDSGQRTAALESLGELAQDLLVVVRASRRGVDAARELISTVPQRRLGLAVNGPAAPGWSAADVSAALNTRVVADLPRQKWLARDDELTQAYELLHSRRGAELLGGLLHAVGAPDAWGADCRCAGATHHLGRSGDSRTDR